MDLFNNPLYLWNLRFLDLQNGQTIFNIHVRLALAIPPAFISGYFRFYFHEARTAQENHDRIRGYINHLLSRKKSRENPDA